MQTTKTEYEVRDETGYLVATVDGLANAKREAMRLFEGNYKRFAIHNQTSRGTLLVGTMRIAKLNDPDMYRVVWNDKPKLMTFNAYHKALNY